MIAPQLRSWVSHPDLQRVDFAGKQHEGTRRYFGRVGEGTGGDETHPYVDVSETTADRQSRAYW